jgi:hypothetical protein
MAEQKKKPTHTAYAMKRIGRKFVRWLEVGTGRQNEDGSFQGFIDRTPIGGWTGAVYFAPIGSLPPLPPPDRPDEREQEQEPTGEEES